MERKKGTRLDKDVWEKAKTQSIQAERSVEAIINSILREVLSEGMLTFDKDGNWIPQKVNYEVPEEDLGE